MTKGRALLVAAVALIAVALGRMKATKQSEWKGLTESEARTKLNERFPNRLPEDKRDAISDKVIATMKARGVIAEDLVVDIDNTDTAEESIDLRETQDDLTKS